MLNSDQTARQLAEALLEAIPSPDVVYQLLTGPLDRLRSAMQRGSPDGSGASRALRLLTQQEDDALAATAVIAAEQVARQMSRPAARPAST